MSVRDLPPLAQLRAFAALAESGSVSGAGRLLNVSHAAISQQIRALEGYLGITLTRKDGRGVALTPAGSQLGQTLTEAFGDVVRQVDALTGADATRPLQITTTPMFAAEWLMPRIGTFREAHPDVDLMLNPTAAPVALEPGGIDLAIRFGQGVWPGLTSELLVSTQFVIVAARSLIGDRQITEPEELLEFPWLQEVGTTETNDWLAARGVTRRRVKGMIEMPGNLLLAALRDGQGVAAATRTFVEADVQSGDIVVLFEGDDRGFGYFLLHRPGPLRPPVKAFANWLRREARQSADLAGQIIAACGS